MKHFLTLFFVALLSLQAMDSCVAQEQNRRDGNMWVKLESLPDQQVGKLLRASYVAGLVDGMPLEAAMLGDVLVDRGVPHPDSLLIANYLQSAYTSFKNISNQQIMDGLDSFYSDFRNRRIMWMWAVYYVVKEIDGTSQEELDTMIEHLRRNATE